MDSKLLSEKLEAKLKEERPDEDKIFIKLLRQVWEVDWTVAPYDVLTHMMELDIPYFLRFMGVDLGDEEVEEQLIQEWIAARTTLQSSSTGQEWRKRFAALINEVNDVRVGVTQSDG